MRFDETDQTTSGLVGKQSYRQLTNKDDSLSSEFLSPSFIREKKQEETPSQ